jgi:hypothetical protein
LSGATAVVEFDPESVTFTVILYCPEEEGVQESVATSELLHPAGNPRYV